MPQLQSSVPETILAADSAFKGELAFEGTVRIEGKFEGKVATKGRLIVGKNAHVSGEMAVGSIVVEGCVQGNLAAAEKVELAASSQVTGDIRATRLIVAEGATLVGHLVISPDAHAHKTEARGAVERDQILAVPAPQLQPARR